MFKRLTLLGCYVCVVLVVSVYAARSEEDPVKTLRDLTDYEMDYSLLLQQCKEKVTNNKLKEDLAKMETKSKENVQSLSVLIKEHGGKVPAYRETAQGMLREAYTAIRGAVSDKGVLSSLQGSQESTLKAFENALVQPNLPESVAEKVQEIVARKQEEIKATKDAINTLK